jgi:DNA polymerase-1
MNKGYTQAFPIVVTYQNQVIQGMYAKGYVVNIRGRRYYVNNSNRYYKCGNYLIQGSCADLLKEKMIEIDDFLNDNNLNDKIQMILCVHDELQFEELVAGYEWAIAKIKEIMEDCPDVMVPIVAEVEKTTTTWDQKKAYHLEAA